MNANNGNLKFTRHKKIMLSIIFLLSVVIILASIFSYYKIPNRTADGLTDSTQAKYIEELTLTGDAQGKGGKVFDGGRLNQLYRLLFGDNATYDTVRNKASEVRSTPSGGVGGLSVGKTFSEFSNTVVVKIGGINWIATTLTVDKVNGDTVLTLWRENTPNETQFITTYSSGWRENNPSKNYPSSSYSASYIRSQLLNGRDMTDNDGNVVEVKYATDSSTLVDFTPYSTPQTANYPYELFTNTDYANNLTEYIVKPTKIAYQETQDRYTNLGGGGTTRSSANECYGIPINGFHLGDANGVQNSPVYNDWQYDYIWLPSSTESYEGLWNASVAVRANYCIAWTRSASWNSTWRIDCDGATQYVDATGAIRPAFHFNLTKAQEAAAVGIPQDDEVKKYYANGGNVEFNLDNIDLDKMEIDTAIDFTAVKNESATGDMTFVTNNSSTVFKASVPGKYVVTCRPKGSNVWTDGTTVDKTYTFKLVYKVGTLSFVGQDSKTYTGDDVEFQLGGSYDKTKVNVEATTSGLTFDNSATPAVLKAKTVGEYFAKAELVDKDLMEWGSADGDVADKTLKVTITKRPLTLTFIPSTAWSWSNGTQKQVSIKDDRAYDSEILNFVFSYSDGDTSTELFGATPDGTVAKQTNVTIPGLNNGNYTFSVKLDNSGDGKNYEITGTSARPFSITDRKIVLTEADIAWQYSSVNYKDGQPQSIGTWDSNTVVEVFYNGSDYLFEIDESELTGLGVKLDKYEGQTNQQCGLNYSTTVTLSPIESGATINGKSSESFTLKWKISQGKYDLSKVIWNYKDGTLEYSGDMYTIDLINPYSATLTPNIQGNSGSIVKSDYKAVITGFSNTDNNFVTPKKGDPTTYDYIDGEEFPWELVWSIEKAKLNLVWNEVKVTDKNGRTFTSFIVNADNADKIERYEYYRFDGGVIGDRVQKDDIEVIPGQESYYCVKAILKSNFEENYKIVGGETWAMTVGSNKTEVMIEMPVKTIEYDGNAHGGDSELSVTSGTLNIANVIKQYYSISDDGERTPLASGEVPKNAGKYVVELSLNDNDGATRYLGAEEIAFEITKVKIKAEWNTSGNIPILSNLNDALKDVVGYVYYDLDGNELPDGAELERGKTYKIKAIIKGDNALNYEFVASDGITVLEEPTMTDEVEFTAGKKGTTGGSIGGWEDLKDLFDGIPLWQLIVSIIGLILTIAFLSKMCSCESKRKKAKKKIDKYTSYYAGVFLGIAIGGWTAIACSLAGMAVVSFAAMLIAMRRQSGAEDELDDAKEEFDRNRADVEAKRRDENMQMMFMHMMGGNNGQGMPQGAFVQQGLGAEEMRGLISETVTALLPGMQQMLPQQASTNDELVNKLIEQNEKLMHQLAEKSTEKIIEKEVVATTANDETIKALLEGQKAIMQKLAEQPAQQAIVQPQIIEKIVEKPVEKVVEVPVEKVIEKEVRVEVPVETVVEKVVEKPIVISTEAVGEAEKSKQVKTPTPKKAPAPRLTLEEAYAKLTKEQKKYFDGLREYAMSKDSKCKEKLSTYFTTIGPSTTNPFIKLTIKKGITVALFKMEDEYLKDIRRNASGDGTKVKVKETEVPIGDKQAYETAKDMVDLRLDQIDRYNDFLKEQRALRKS